MQPSFFKTQDALTSFLKNLPTPSGRANVMGENLDAQTILKKCVALVPRIFEYKQILAKGAGGLGSNKAVFRYADVMSDRVSQESLEAYQETLEEINREIEVLLEAGGGDQMAQTLSGARTKVAMFTQMKDTIEGFRDNLNRYMARVEEKYASLSAHLVKSKREISKTLDCEMAQLLINEVSDKHKNVQELIGALNEYCALQVAYSGIMMGAR